MFWVSSYSWSANVCGVKEWLLYPPGEEELLRDRLGNLPLDITSEELMDRVRYPNAHRATPPLRVVQRQGEIIFIPRWENISFLRIIFSSKLSYAVDKVYFLILKNFWQWPMTKINLTKNFDTK